jgi:hypothetical protein
MTFGELAFGELTFGELAFGELTFGEMTFGKLSGHHSMTHDRTKIRCSIIIVDGPILVSYSAKAENLQ